MSEEIPIKSESVDMVFIDPPFNQGLKYDTVNDKMEKKDYLAWADKFIGESFRILKPTGSFYLMNRTSWIGYMQVIADKYGIFKNMIVWRHSQNPTKNKYLHEWQGIIFYTKTNDYYFNEEAQFQPHRHYWGWKDEQKDDRGMRITDIWSDIKKVSGGVMASKEAILKKNSLEKEHIAQMPVALVERAILHSTRPGDVVTDVFLGSGTTARAALETERKFIGGDKGYQYVSVPRCEVYQQRLFI